MALALSCASAGPDCIIKVLCRKETHENHHTLSYGKRLCVWSKFAVLSLTYPAMFLCFREEISSWTIAPILSTYVILVFNLSFKLAASASTWEKCPLLVSGPNWAARLPWYLHCHGASKQAPKGGLTCRNLSITLWCRLWKAIFALCASSMLKPSPFPC